jgi:hypothetical protein
LDSQDLFIHVSFRVEDLIVKVPKAEMRARPQTGTSPLVHFSNTTPELLLAGRSSLE